MNKIHYFDMEVNSITRDKIKSIEWEKSKVLFKNSEKIPEGENIVIFSWVFSQNFQKWEKSRNWYKYDQEWWILENYARLPIILWQHQDDYGGIGYTQELWLDTKWNLCWLFYVDTETLEERHANQVKKWFVKSVSTGAITLETMFEHNETGKRYSRKEAEEEFGFENIWRCLCWFKDSILTYIVTKAELVENSLVTIWSNYWAIAKKVNSLNDEMREEAEKLKNLSSKQDETLFLNQETFMKKENLGTNDTSTNTTPVVLAEVPETTPKEENGVNVDSLKNELEAEKNKVSELQNSFDTYKNEAETKINSLTLEKDNLQKEVNEFKEKAKTEILENAPNVTKWENNNGVKTVADFKKKHSKN